MARACILTHGRAPTVGDGLERLARVAARHGVELIMPAIERAKHSMPEGVSVVEGEGEGADLAVVLGGDGTTLRALNRFVGSETPVFAINYGRVGFLTTARSDQLEDAIGRAFVGEYRIETLPTVAAARNGQRLGAAINDAVVTSDVHGRIASLGWYVDDVDMGAIRCDAMVVSTPAGSTAYSLSAGGPVLGWGLDGLCVTFVAPHSLSARSLVLPRGHRVGIENRGDDVDARLVIDGHQEHRALAPGDRVEMGLGDEWALLALLPEVSFLERYRDTFASF